MVARLAGQFELTGTSRTGSSRQLVSTL